MPSLRAKLTGYYLAILAVVLVLLGIAIYLFISRGLLEIIDDSLSFQATTIEQRIASGSGEYVPETHALRSNQFAIALHLIQLVDANGKVSDEIALKPDYAIPADFEVLRHIPVSGTTHETIVLPSGEPLRIATRHARDADGDDYYIRIGGSLGALRAARSRLLLVLLLGVLATLVLGSYGGLLLANQALRPVDRITRAAEQIGAGDLSERVPTPPQMDEIGRLATTFNHMIARLEAAFERQKQFTSDVSHELRTPLAVMRGDMEIALRRTRTAEEYQQVLGSSLEEIIRLSRLVEDLLTLARADSGRTQLRWEPISLDTLCRQMVDYILPLATQRDQALNYEGPEADVVINGDLNRLKQLLLNLLDNAIKYTDHNGTVTLSLRSTQDRAVIEVRDTGRGIPKEDLPHIFDRFFRRSKSTPDRTATGFGLGLSIVKWIVDSHGGTIEAESELGKGTTFRLKFPLNAKVDTTVHHAPASVAHSRV